MFSYKEPQSSIGDYLGPYSTSTSPVPHSCWIVRPWASGLQGPARGFLYTAILYLEDHGSK